MRVALAAVGGVVLLNVVFIIGLAIGAKRVDMRRDRQDAFPVRW